MGAIYPSSIFGSNNVKASFGERPEGELVGSPASRKRSLYRLLQHVACSFNNDVL